MVDSLDFEGIRGKGVPIQKKPLDGLVAIVTGAGGYPDTSLGAAYALELALNGASVVINDIDRPDKRGLIEALIRTIEEFGGKATAAYFDISSPEGGRAVVETAMSTYNRLDILVNNAGILDDTAYHKMTDEQWLRVMAVNANGWHYVTQPALEAMKQTSDDKKVPYGRIISVTSPAVAGSPLQVQYSFTKGGIIGASKTLALEVAHKFKGQITVNVVMPVAYTAGMTAQLMDGPWLDMIKRYRGADVVPAKEFHPNKVAVMVTTLAMPEAKGINGHVYQAGGGAYRLVDFMISPGYQYRGEEPLTPEKLLKVLPGIDTINLRPTVLTTQETFRKGG